MLIEQLKNQCKDKGKLFQTGRVFLIQQSLSQHCDFLTMSWMIHELENEKKVAFVALRQNYAHYLSLSKKLGKSIEPFLKSKQLKYYQCFQSSFCQSQFPLTQTSPNSYISPPNSITKLKANELYEKQNLFQQNSVVFVDAISFLQDSSQIIFKLYEEAMNNNCNIIMGGVMENSQLTHIFRQDFDIFVKIQNDVGNHGKIKLLTSSWELNLHWKHVQGKFQVTQYIKL